MARGSVEISGYGFEKDHILFRQGYEKYSQKSALKQKLTLK